VLLYEMVSGRVPFDATTIGRLVEQISKGEYQSPSQRNPGVPREVEAIIARCLKRNPAARYQSAHELLTDVRRVMTALNPPPAGSAIQTTTLPAPWLRNNWQTLTIAAMALTIVALLVIVATSGGVSPPPQSSSAPAVAAPNVAAPTPSAAPAASAEMRTVRINTLEGRADVYRNSQMVGTTPYEITAPLGERVRLTLKRAGYEDELLDFVITENKKEYTITMKRP
jgi:serine/threonine protein kinase